MKHKSTCAMALPLIAAALAIATGANAASNAILPSVTAMNQKLKSDAVDITYAYLPADGRLAILSGDPEHKANAAVIGTMDLNAGDHRDIKIRLSEAPKAGTRLWAAVEQAKSGKPFPGSDERAEQSFRVL